MLSQYDTCVPFSSAWNLAKPVEVDCVGGTSSLPDRLVENVSPSCAWIELKDKEIAAIDMVAANIATNS